MALRITRRSYFSRIHLPLSLKYHFHHLLLINLRQDHGSKDNFFLYNEKILIIIYLKEFLLDIHSLVYTTVNSRIYQYNRLLTYRIYRFRNFFLQNTKSSINRMHCNLSNLVIVK
jgi:hypothetical protein